MLTRREMVTGTALGAVATTVGGVYAASDAPAAVEYGLVAQEVDNGALRRIADKTSEIDETLDGLARGITSNSLAFGHVPRLRDIYTTYLRIHGKFPDFCDVGTDVFYDIYDWHIKNRQPVPVKRPPSGPMSITFMYTELIVRIDQDPNYFGVPYDRT
jgi:hypothetical protein